MGVFVFVCVYGGGAPESAHFQGHLCIFCNTATRDSLQLGTSPAVKTLLRPDPTMAKKLKYAWVPTGDITQVHGDVLGWSVFL